MSDEINKALDLKPIDLSPGTTLVPIDNDNGQLSDDFEFARGNMLNAIMKGQEALDGILEVAAMSQHPRSYEVAAKLMDSISNANKNLLDLRKAKQDIDGTTSGPKTVHNNLFVGSTAELQKFLKQNSEQK